MADNVSRFSPVLLTVLAAVVGVVGTGVGAILQGMNETTLERQKFEYGLIQDALEAETQEMRAQNLTFLVDVGLLQQLDINAIRTAAETPASLPALPQRNAGSARSNVSFGKSLLSALDRYNGRINDYS